jgi:glycosyltransferase involved in cell wall biosynthesis
MNVSILHYHTRPGGVTRIIQSQIACLSEIEDIDGISLITGPSGDPKSVAGDARIITNPNLGYLSKDISTAACVKLHDRIEKFIRKTIAPSDILHIHNSSLGKNPVLTCVVARLVRDGYRVFMHFHDFAEDRPDNLEFLRRIIKRYFSDDPSTTMYPAGQHCHYGVLNSTDFSRLVRFGLNGELIDLLPNPVQVPPNGEHWDQKACQKQLCDQFGLPHEIPIYVYPVRPIRRKNVGEFILFATLFRERATWLVTLSPKNPEERDTYDKWRQFAESVRANITFEVGETADFETIMYGADRIVTTSIMEGFGMVFLESWLFGKSVVGRNLPKVTRDFRENGLALKHLYDRLPVIHDDRNRDFGMLTPQEQMDVISKLATDAEAREEFLHNTGIEKILFAPIPAEHVDCNMKAIRNHYSIEAYGKRLAEIYRRLS